MTLAYLSSPVVRANSQRKGLFLPLPICVGDLVKNVDFKVFIRSTPPCDLQTIPARTPWLCQQSLSLWNQQGDWSNAGISPLSGAVCQVVVIICATVYILVFKYHCYHGQCNFSQGTGRQLHLFPNALWQRNQKARSEFPIVTTQRLLHVAELISLP